MFNCFLSLFVSVQVSDVYVNVLSIIMFFSLNYNFFDMLLFLKNKICFVRIFYPLINNVKEKYYYLLCKPQTRLSYIEWTTCFVMLKVVVHIVTTVL